MNENKENSIVNEIKNEYKKIDGRWLKLHYKTFIYIVVLAFLFEGIAAVSLYVAGYIEISLTKYTLKYLLTPLIINICFIMIGVWVMKFSNFEQKIKTYFISLLFVGVCFVFFTVHIIFNSLYFVFFAPILLTIIYSDYILTTVTSIVSILTKAISELLITWDPDKVFPFDSEIGITNFIISTFILLSFYFITMIIVKFEKAKNAASIQKEMTHYEVQQKLIIDEVTNIYNRTALRDAFQDVVDDQSDNTYTFAMMDLDNFKILNDTLGHIKGDKYLKELGRILKDNCPDEATPFRYGGDEFCILFRNTTVDDTINVCENIQCDLQNSALNKSADTPLTISIGIASYEKGMSPKQLLRNSDLALYKAKESKDSIHVYNTD